ncbi:MAG: HAD family hydrolase [Vicinamibacterales bacterium]
MRATLYPVVVFDCDGVLLESNDVKTRAFVDVFADLPAHRDDAVAYHLTHMGIARDVKMRAILTRIRGHVDELEVAERSGRFAALIREGMLSCPKVTGVDEALEACSGRRTYVASGTPEAELKQVLASRGLGAGFVAIYGSPATKPDILRRVISDEGVEPGAVLFIGDSQDDRSAAEAVGVGFVARTSHDPGLRSSGALPVVSDLRQLADFLQRLDLEGVHESGWRR